MDFRLLVDYFWNVDILAELQDQLPFKQYLQLELRDSHIKDSEDHHVYFILQWENVSSTESIPCRRDAHKAAE